MSVDAGGIVPPPSLHRAFWSIYAISSAAFAGLSCIPQAPRGPIMMAAFALFQEALFVVFVRFEGLYPAHLRRPGLYAALAASNLAILGGFSFGVAGGLVPGEIAGPMTAAGGIVGGNLAAVLVLSVSFRIAGRRPARIRGTS